MASNKAKRAKELRRQQERRHRRSDAADAQQPSPSPQPVRALSQWHQRPAAERAALEKLDGHAHLRNQLRELARMRSEWAGIPMPLSSERLVIEPRYPYAALSKIGAPLEDEDPEPGWKVRNSFWSTWRRCEVVIFEEADGRITRAYLPGVHSLSKQLHTLGCAEAWGIEQESKAVHTLGSLVSHLQFRQYMMTGSFLERSKRSGLYYLFRRLRPTAVIEAEEGAGESKVRCTLCLHPIGYYAESWAGAMCPTDDVIAHLMMMRGDEPMFWRKANQHPPHRPEAGL